MCVTRDQDRCPKGPPCPLCTGQGATAIFLGQAKPALPLVKLTSTVNILRTTDAGLSAQTRIEGKVSGPPVYSQEHVPGGFIGDVMREWTDKCWVAGTENFLRDQVGHPSPSHKSGPEVTRRPGDPLPGPASPLRAGLR